MGNNCSTEGKGSQDGLPYHVSRFTKGSKKDFIDAYITRIAVIIEHYEVYLDFHGKIPEPIYLAKEFLQDFASHFNECETIDQFEFVTRLTTRSKQYINQYLHRKIKQICQYLYQQTHETKSRGIVQTKEAEERLRSYEINVLRIIGRLSKQSFESCNHLKVAKQVIDELITQVKKNGVNDNNGKNIKDYPSYIYKIVISRMNDERKRHQRLRSFPDENFDYFESQKGRKDIENKIIIDELHEYLRNQFFSKISSLEGFIFRTYYLEDEYNQSKIKELIYNIFGIHISVSSISRILKKLVEMISEDFFYTTFEIDNLYRMANASNLKPLQADWLFLFLDAKCLNLWDEFGKKKKYTHFIGYGVSRDAREGILINKVFCGYESLDQWQQILQGFKNRGMSRLLMMVTGDSPSFVPFTREFFPKVDHQLSLYQLQKNAHKYLRKEDYTLFKTTFDDIFSCVSFDDAYHRLIGLCQKLGKKYNEFTNNLEEKAENFLAFIKYPGEIWKNINIFKIDEILNKEINAIGQYAKKKNYHEKELIAKTNIKIKQLFKSSSKDYDSKFEAALPLLTTMFNQRF